LQTYLRMSDLLMNFSAMRRKDGLKRFVAS